MDGVVGFMEGRFEFAVWQWCCSRYDKRGCCERSADDIVSVTVSATDLNEVPKMNEVYRKLIPDPKPARVALQAAGLIGGSKIEIAAISVKQ